VSATADDDEADKGPAIDPALRAYVRWLRTLREHADSIAFLAGIFLVYLGIGVALDPKVGNVTKWVAAPLVILVGCSAAVVAIVFSGAFRSGRQFAPTEPTLTQRMQAASSSLEATSVLVNELQAEMQANRAALDRVRAENAQYERLAAVHRKEAEAVAQLVENVILATHEKLGRRNRRDQLVFFALGLLAAAPVQLLIDWIR
jgi:hypothetical protein